MTSSKVILQQNYCTFENILYQIREQRYREHIPYIRNNDPQPAYAQYILQNQHEYGSITDTMTLLKPIHKMSMLTPYEQLFIRTFHHNGNLIMKQGTGEQTPLFQLAMDTVLTSAAAPKQIGTIPTAHTGQLQLSHNRGR